ncbi:SWIM zinc finger family protein [uncultured Rubinisphaera sp.]|uniref:SWIM zinc finger family protein n=1 Tax=uncultured Rubinisphaera sp. TaxID=1678686 RepID=UPI000C0CEAF9|nr:hypothetical protein [Rubinisphaera sp.]HCS54932.1 hypothetical protein [Planctomycetaceae bacterium]|tara:strand:+ start:1083 stop:2105 length:1023 start_codon:yes stop_codon:yes gene_type:complete
MSWDYGWQPYVSVGERKRQGYAEARRLIGKGHQLKSITISGNKIAKTFWGEAWCKHLEKYSDFSNRLPRGRTYARNGSIAHLEITSGKITAMVCGSELYQVEISIEPLAQEIWKILCGECTTSVHSVLDLMRGKLPKNVIQSLTHPKTGMFPRNAEIELDCDCPDGANLCKHLAAVLYGVGNRLDQSPELLFLLRGVQQTDLISSSLNGRVDSLLGNEEVASLDNSDLSEIFRIDLDESTTVSSKGKPWKKSPKRTARKKANSQKKKKTTKKSTTSKKTVKKRTVKKVVKKKPTKTSASKKKTTELKPVRNKLEKKKAVKKTRVKKKAAKKKSAKKKYTT